MGLGGFITIREQTEEKSEIKLVLVVKNLHAQFPCI